MEIKLQAGCLAVLIYLIIIYLRETKLNGTKKCSKLFDVLLFVAPWGIVFDAVTAWTANHMSSVPLSLNLLFHALFMILNDSVIVIIFLYLLMETTTITPKKPLFYVAMLPGIASVLGVLTHIKTLYFLSNGRVTYSMGTAPVICYSSLVFHFGLIFLLLIFKRRALEKRKIFGISASIVMVASMLTLQVIFPTVLISSMFPLLMTLTLYIYFENPALKRLETYNDTMVVNFATLVENRDNNTGGHIRRTKEYVNILLDAMRHDPRYRNICTKDYRKHVLNAAPMHDIGKIAIPDSILNKPGRFEPEEFEIMKTHSSKGAEIISETFFEGDDPDLKKVVYEVARHHHEKWNGKGYPDGLKGNEIPLHARVMAIADVFDAVSAKRVYRDAMPLPECFKIIEEGAGTDFDPELVKLFMASKDKVIDVFNSNK